MSLLPTPSWGRPAGFRFKGTVNSPQESVRGSQCWGPRVHSQCVGFGVPAVARMLSISRWRVRAAGTAVVRSALEDATAPLGSSPSLSVSRGAALEPVQNGVRRSLPALRPCLTEVRTPGSPLHPSCDIYYFVMIPR